MKNLLSKLNILITQITQIQYLVEKLNREMNGIRIVKRSKRGLVNLMGTIYK